MLEIRLLGAFELKAGGRPVELPSRLAQSLLAYLVLNRGTPHRREKLAGMFWPDSPEERARASLRHELWRIRKALAAAGQPDALLTDDITVAFAPASEYLLDVARFEQAADDASAEQSMQALSAYGGELLPGFYDDWAVVEREHLQLIFERRVERLLETLEAEQRWSEAVEWAERWISLGQNPEAAHRALIVAYEALGDQARLRAAYARYAEALHALGQEPPEEIRTLVEKEQRPTNLPAALTALIGRQAELDEISGLLQTSRLVTLTGAGGVGKTRLAIEAARNVADAFPDGVWYVELAPIMDPVAVPERLRSLLRIRGTVSEGQSAVDLLCAHLRSRQALIVIDNCEHLIDACCEVASTLLASCPALHILTTSREPLRLIGEIAYRVPSLELPSAEHMADPDRLRNIASIQLFAERATARSHEFRLTPENVRQVAAICMRLDGIPLAIELAAARIGTLPVQTIEERLNDRFALLTAGSRSDVPRHQTLHAMIDWSHELLTEAERVLLRRLSVFAGGWTLEAAEKIAGEGTHGENEVLGLLPGLVEKSLVMLDMPTGRYRMLETVREYALERLREASEEERVRTRHLDYFLMVAEAADLAAMHGEASSARLTVERDNLISAITWSENAEDGIQRGLLLVGATRLIWFLIPELDMPHRLARRLLALPGGAARNYARCRALLTLVQLAYYLGHGADLDVLSAAAESVAIAREIGDRRREAQTLNIYGGLVALAGDPGKGLRYLNDALGIARELGLVRLTGKILSDTAGILVAGRDLTAAESMYEQAIAVLAEVEAPHDLLMSLLSASTVAIARGNLETAKRRLLDVIQLMHEIPRGLADPAPCLQTSGSLLAVFGEWHHAALLFGAAERQRELANRALERAEQLYSMPLVEKTCGALGEANFHTAWAEGRQLSVQEAVRAAREWLAAADK